MIKMESRIVYLIAAICEKVNMTPDTTGKTER